MSMLEKLGINSEIHHITYKGRTIGYAKLVGPLGGTCNLGASAGSNVWDNDKVTVNVGIVYQLRSDMGVYLYAELSKMISGTVYYIMHKTGSVFTLDHTKTSTTVTGFGGTITAPSSIYGVDQDYDLYIALYSSSSGKLDELTCPNAVHYKQISSPKLSTVTSLTIS